METTNDQENDTMTMHMNDKENDTMAAYIKAIEVAEARCGDRVGAERAIELAEDIYSLAIYANDELQERFSAWNHVTNWGNEPRGLYAVHHLVMLQMLMQAPDLLPLCIERAYREVHATLLGTEQQ